MLDTIVAAAVEEEPRNDPPTAPAAASCYIVGAAPTGLWLGHESELAAFSPAGWRFIAPTEGLQAWVKSTSIFAVYRSGVWELGVVRAAQLSIGGQQVVGARAGAIADVTGGSTVDAQARAAIATILGAIRQHGLIATA